MFGRLSAIAIDTSGDGALRGEIPCSGMKETALILAEACRRGTDWKLRIVEQGFEGGLAAMAPHFGVEVAADPAPAAATKLAPAVAPKAEAPAAAPLNPASLTKVSLTKQGQSSKI